MKISSNFLRNFTFGIEDGLVSTVGLLSGIAAADVGKREILITGVVLIFVEAFSMAVGTILSEHSADEYEAKSELPLGKTALDGLVMFLSYLFAGFVPLFPYLIYERVPAFVISILASLAMLFLLGWFDAKISKAKVIKSGLQMSIIGGSAIALGVIVGKIINNL